MKTKPPCSLSLCFVTMAVALHLLPGCSQVTEEAQASDTITPKDPQGPPTVITFEMLLHLDRDIVAPNITTVPKKIQSLEGKQVVILGYLVPFESALGKFCLLVVSPEIPRDRRVPIPLADEYVYVHLKEEWSGPAPIQQVRISGTMHLEEMLEEGTGRVMLMYHIEDAVMEVEQKRAMGSQGCSTSLP